MKAISNQITTRSIAGKAGVGIGLINYHFQTKDNLIEISVEQIINKVVTSFIPKPLGDIEPINRLINSAIQVFDFLFENPSVSRISIMSNFAKAKLADNTANTIKGFTNSFCDNGMTENERNIFLFSLTSTMQSAFLRRDISKELLGYDLNIKSERDSFITDTINIMYKKMVMSEKNNKERCAKIRDYAIVIVVFHLISGSYL